jgi:hypothetical protein
MPYKNPEIQRAAQRQHYQDNKARYRERQQARKIEYYSHVLEHFKNNPCVDCGETDPLVLEFDHRDRAEKEFTIGAYNDNRFGVDRLKKEILKCDVRCANCHRRRTAVQMNWTIHEIMKNHYGPEAQLEVRFPTKELVVGSSPTRASNICLGSSVVERQTEDVGVEGSIPSPSTNNHMVW